MDRLCANGWSVYYNKTQEKPHIFWELKNTNRCEPTFTRICKKNDANYTNTCEERNLNAAYVVLGRENYNIYLDKIRNRQ